MTRGTLAGLWGMAIGTYLYLNGYESIGLAVSCLGGFCTTFFWRSEE